MLAQTAIDTMPNLMTKGLTILIKFGCFLSKKFETLLGFLTFEFQSTKL